MSVNARVQKHRNKLKACRRRRLDVLESKDKNPYRSACMPTNVGVTRSPLQGFDV